MSDMTTTRSFVALALFVTVGTWWLSNTALQASTSFAAVPVLGVQAAYVLVLGQCLLVCLVAIHGESASRPAAAVAALSLVVPLWPLFALLWLTSELSFWALGITQVSAFVLALVVALVGERIGRLAITDEARTTARSAAGLALALAIWFGRSQLHAWVTA